jgi:hypothetical protein
MRAGLYYNVANRRQDNSHKWIIDPSPCSIPHQLVDQLLVVAANPVMPLQSHLFGLLPTKWQPRSHEMNDKIT